MMARLHSLQKNVASLPRHAAVVFGVIHAIRQAEPLAQRIGVEDAVAPAPFAPLRAIGTRARLAERDVFSREFFFERRKVDARFHAAAVAWRERAGNRTGESGVRWARATG